MSLNICVVCSDRGHPIWPLLEQWGRVQQSVGTLVDEVRIESQLSAVGEGDLLFLVSCTEKAKAEVLAKFRHVLVLHASDLPEGRGWSPMIWQVLAGARHIVVSLIEARDPIDSGAIWYQVSFELEGHELADELNGKLFAAELSLMSYAVENFYTVKPREQDARPPTYFARRKPADSAIDPYKPIAEQFDLLRVADPVRYPAFFDFRGCRYEIILRKASAESEGKT